jgi:hypothetical protein
MYYIIWDILGTVLTNFCALRCALRYAGERKPLWQLGRILNAGMRSEEDVGKLESFVRRQGVFFLYEAFIGCMIAYLGFKRAWEEDGGEKRVGSGNWNRGKFRLVG